MDANLWSCTDGNKIELSSSQATASSPSSFLFQLPGAEAKPKQEDHLPKDQIKLVSGSDVSLIYRHPISSFTQTYFEMTVVALPSSDCVCVIGLAQVVQHKSLPGWTPGTYGYHSDDGKIFLENGESGKKAKGITQFSVGDVVGCGIDPRGYIIFTLNTKASVKYRIKHPHTSLFPVIGLDGKGVTVKLNMSAVNPLGPYQEGKLPWAPMIGHPLGQVAIGAPTKQDSKFPLLPHDVIKILLSYEVGPVILELCRAVYQKFSNLFKWIDIYEIWKKTPGFYRDLRESNTTFAPYTFGFELRLDGTYKGRYRTVGSDNPKKKGTWFLQNISLNRTEKVIQLAFDSHQEEKLPKPGDMKTIRYEQLKLFKVSEDEAIKNLPEPKLRPMRDFRKCGMRKCGVPLELQTANVDCCFEIVEEIVNSVWDASQYDHLGCDVKTSISQRISRRCMTPPGMTEDEIRIAIAEEIANCDDWNCAFIQAS